MCARAVPTRLPYIVNGGIKKRRKPPPEHNVFHFLGAYESNHFLQQRHRNHHFGNASNQKHDPNHSIINHSLYYRILPIVKTMGIHSKNKKQHHQIEQAMWEKRHHKKYNAAKSHIQHACRKEHPCCKTNSTPQNKWCNLLQRRIRHKADEQK